MPQICDLCEDIAIVVNSFLFVIFVSNFLDSLLENGSKWVNLLFGCYLFDFDETLRPKSRNLLGWDHTVSDNR